MDDALWADWRGLRDDQQPRHLFAGCAGSIVGAIRHPAADDLATAAEPKNQKPERLSAITIHEGVAIVLRFSRHTVTLKQCQPVTSWLSRHNVCRSAGTNKGALSHERTY